MFLGAVGAIGVPVAAAELEGGDEPGLVTVDTPTNPSNNIEQLLSQVTHSNNSNTFWNYVCKAIVHLF